MNKIFQKSQDPRQVLVNGQQFPTIYTPQTFTNFIRLQEYFFQHHQQIVQEVSRVGAILFRGFDIKSANQFSSILNKIGLQNFKYVGGAAVRKLIIGSQNKSNSIQVFTTNQAPPNQPIPLHNQLAQNEDYPQFLSFLCLRSAQTGGSTPIVNCSQLYDFIAQKHPLFLQQLEQKKVRYIRIVSAEDRPDSPIGRGWKNIFGVNTKQQAQNQMKKRGFQWKWIQNQQQDVQLISKILPAIRIAKNGKNVFCNQIIAVFKGWTDCKNKPVDCLKYGDFSDISQQTLQDISNYADKVKASVPWKDGDFILLDNQLVAHSRQPFNGPRKIYASILKGYKEPTKQLEYVLNSGDRMPLIGFGTWKIEKEVCSQVVYNALKQGYKHLDCAAVYANQEFVGDGIQKALTEKIIKRQDLFVTSKLWHQFHRKQNVRPALLRILKDLKLQYLDLFLIHFPISLKYIPFEQRYPPEWIHDLKSIRPYMAQDNVPIIQTWRAMQELVNEGLVKNIGISNFGISLMRDLINSSTIKPAVNQVQIHPYLTQKTLIRYCRQVGIHVTSYSTLGAASYIPQGMSNQQQLITHDKKLISIAQRNKKSLVQIVLRWAVQQGLSIVPKTIQIARLRQNSDLIGWQLTNPQMNQIDELNKNRRYNNPATISQSSFGTFFPIFE